MSDNDEFDARLSDVMQRVDAPPTMERSLLMAAEAESRRRAEVVEARAVAQGGGRSVLRFPGRTLWRGAAAAALLIVCALGGLHLRHAREQAQATAEFELSERITERTLAQTRQQLQSAGVSLDQ